MILTSSKKGTGKSEILAVARESLANQVALPSVQLTLLLSRPASASCVKAL